MGEPIGGAAAVDESVVVDEAGAEDAGIEDAGAEGAGAEDAGYEDAGAEDAVAEDAGAEDAGYEDGPEAGPGAAPPPPENLAAKHCFMSGWSVFPDIGVKERT